MSNNSDQINHIIKLDIGELNQENPSESNENDENKENSENFNTSNKEYSSNNNPEIKLEEDEQNNLKNNSKINQKNNSKNATKKAKSRRSRLTIDPQEESTPQHPKKIYTEEGKRNGKGKEYDKNTGKLIYEGRYFKGDRVKENIA